MFGKIFVFLTLSFQSVSISMELEVKDVQSLKMIAAKTFAKKSLEQFIQELELANAPKEVHECIAYCILEGLHNLIEIYKKNRIFIDKNVFGDAVDQMLVSITIGENIQVDKTLNSYLGKFNVLLEHDKTIIKISDANHNSIMHYLLALEKDIDFMELVPGYVKFNGDVFNLLSHVSSTQSNPIKYISKILKACPKDIFSQKELDEIKFTALVIAGYRRSMHEITALNSAFDSLIKEYLGSKAQ